MTYVITRSCCNEASCQPVCPVNCIHPTPDEPDYGTTEMLYIDPQACIDCGACLDRCPVSAIVPDYELEAKDEPYLELNALWYEGAGRRDYPQTPNATSTRTWTTADGTALRVAIVGSGPAAFFAAGELLGQRGLDVAVDMFERLPAPGGLVRYGVAPDHQDTKAIADVFARTMRRAGFRLFLNTHVGSDITLDELRSRYHAVIIAVGALTDRALDVPGEDLSGSHSATEFVAWYNGHPDFADRSFDLSAERAIVVGNGNVALDVARVLSSDPDRLAGTDISDRALEQLRASRVREVVVIARRGPAEAAFTTKELLSLIDTDGIDVGVQEDEVESAIDAGDALVQFKVGLLRELATRPDSSPHRRVTLRFRLSPVELLGKEHVERIRLERTRLERGSGGEVRAVATGEFEEMSCGLVFRAVGYRGTALPGIPFDESRGTIPHRGGRVIDPDSGDSMAGLYVTGWIGRGPTGVIGTNKKDARQSVSALLEDFGGGLLPAPAEDCHDIGSRLPEHLGLDGWRRIDAHERASGAPIRRPRVKLTTAQEMLAVARESQL